MKCIFNCGLRCGLGLFVGGTLFGTAGIAILKSRDAKRAYTEATAAVLRGKDSVMKTVSTLKENCDDIYEDARDINEKRYAEDEKRAVEEAKALIAEYEAKQSGEAEAPACAAEA
ncbi:hypothetical protein EI53_00537 [Fusobacterium naviforme]|uniref:Uncharacterized protein n=1 Tax=Moryella indoligenes TaxID=371674 RepID=A0AAE3V972_9FIRM|nr:DUF6110 family protein [Moryella indoligenes]KAB0578739.1 hypothetical protein F7P78_02690 [Fusobacterium naviforme]MDQ0152014.1 hypothetical protein [Moryella indoligenes]PSL11506.1 hypothetical protein EI53_00537 [Fusobacterium naviforme]STO26588.1 Uncharacterised protein [Fusobacterium naviforme]